MTLPTPLWLTAHVRDFFVHRIITPSIRLFSVQTRWLSAQSGCVCVCVCVARAQLISNEVSPVAGPIKLLNTRPPWVQRAVCVLALFISPNSNCPRGHVLPNVLDHVHASITRHHRDPVEPFRRRGLSSHSQLDLFGHARSTWFAAETWCGQGRTVAQGRRGIASCQIDHSCWRRIGPIAIDMYEWTIAVDATESVVRDCMSKWIDFSWWRSMVDVSRWRGGMDIVR